MKRRTDEVLLLVVAILGIIATASISSCVKINEDTNQTTGSPTQPTQNASPAVQVSPSTSPLPPVATVTVSEFAREGGNGPCGEGTTLRVGCSAFDTCTPRDSGGVDVGPRYVPEWTTAGATTVTPTLINVYNAKVQCDHGGTGIIACSVGGKVGTIQYDCVP